MTRTQWLLLPLLLALCCMGCLEIDRDYVINSDGSGKVMVEETMPNLEGMIDPDGKPQGEKALREFAASIVERSMGVELWKDVSYKALPGGRQYFKGTAYFNDVNAVKFYGLSNTDVTIMPTGDAKAVIAFPEPPQERDTGAGEPLTEADIEYRIDSMRAVYREGAEIMAGFRSRLRYHIAGTVEESVGFVRDSGGGVTLELDGPRMLASLDSLTGTEGYWRKVATSSSRGMLAREAMETLYGGAIPHAVVATSQAPLFDYEAEVKGARRQYRALRNKLGVK